MPCISRADYFDALAAIQMCLRAHPKGLTLLRLGEKVGATKETIRGRIRRMHQLGLVELIPNPDRRTSGKPEQLVRLVDIKPLRAVPPRPGSEDLASRPALGSPDGVVLDAVSSAREAEG